MRLDDTVLQQYMTGFCGYGDHKAESWLFGMEEGSDGTVDEIARGLNTWRGQGKPELADVVTFSTAIGGVAGQWFRPNPCIQPTWGRLIRILFALRGVSPTREQIRQFQAAELGRNGGANAIIELFPLPVLSTGHWPYASWSSVPYLRDRRSYYEGVGPIRVRRLATRIQEHRPKLVLCYGMQHRAWWEQVAGDRFTPSSVHGLEFTTAGPTLIALIPHPTFHGISDTWLESAGAAIRAALPRN
jgi:hypothetical protein